MLNRISLPSVLNLIVLAFALGSSLPAFSQEQVLFSFMEDDNGAYPQSSVVLDAEGNIFGTANLAGANGAGTVFEMSPASGGGYTYVVLHDFTGAADGSSPRSGLLLDKSGNLFGSTTSGGSSFFGTLFELSPTASGWTFTVIHDFVGGSDGGFPSGNLITDARGNLYGNASVGGGSALCTFGCGVVFELRRSAGGKWAERILYTFQGGNDGAGPIGGLAMDRSGNLYGVTFQGGSAQCTAGCGTVFKLTPTAHGPWQKQSLGAFADKQHGWFPNGDPVLDRAGNLYGTTGLGGDLTCNPPNGCGMLFKITPQGQQTIVHNFGQSTGDGNFPMAGLVVGSGGHLFGSTVSGGHSAGACGIGCGLLFDFAPASGKLRTVYEFTGADGAMPEAPLFSDGAGHLFGTTLEGGTGFAGTVFEVTP